MPSAESANLYKLQSICTYLFMCIYYVDEYLSMVALYIIQAGELYSKLVSKHYMEQGGSIEQWKKVSVGIMLLWLAIDV